MVAQQLHRALLGSRGGLQHSTTSPLGNRGTAFKQAAIVIRRKTAPCAVHQARPNGAISAAEEEAAKVMASDRLASHGLAGSRTRRKSTQQDRSQTVLDADEVSSQVQQVTPVAYWNAFLASRSHDSSRAKHSYESRHLQDYMSQCSSPGEASRAAELINACKLAASEGHEHEVLAILREAQADTKKGLRELTSTSACQGLVQVSYIICASSALHTDSHA